MSPYLILWCGTFIAWQMAAFLYRDIHATTCEEWSDSREWLDMDSV